MKKILLVVPLALLVGCGGATNPSSGTQSKPPLSSNDVTGHNNFFYDQVQTPDGVVDCVIWIPDNDPGLSCNWEKLNASTTTVPETTTTLQGL